MPTPTAAIHTLSLHDALPISLQADGAFDGCRGMGGEQREDDQQEDEQARTRSHGRLSFRHVPRRALSRQEPGPPRPDRKSTRLNSSHLGISYAVFCLKKKKNR